MQPKIIKGGNCRNISLLIQMLCYFPEFYVCDNDQLFKCSFFSSAKQIVTYVPNLFLFLKEGSKIC